MAAESPRASKLSPLARARLVIAVAAFLAYLPSLSGDFVFDDTRFVRDNPAVHQLDGGNAIRYFSDPSTMAATSWRGIYRPLRTLDFAIDWAISGGRPWFFHLKNLLYHILASLLVLSLVRRLLPEDGKRPGAGALAGALLFALHPVQVESVAWITSRGDVLVGVLFLAALLLHLRGRFVTAGLVLLAAFLAKESAVVFPAAALLADAIRRTKLRWRAYAAYGAMAVAYFLLWRSLIGAPRHISQYWGGTWLLNLLTMAKGFLHYVKVILFPVDFTVDWYVPVARGLDAVSAIAVLVTAGLVVAAIRAGRRSRFAVLWFFATLLPVSNLVFPIGIPTAERFLYLPMVGIAVWAAPILARRRAAVVVLACFFLLTFARTFVWRSNEALFDSALEVAETPRALGHVLDRELRRATAANDKLRVALPSERPRIAAEIEEHAERVLRIADRLKAFYRDVVRLPPDRALAVALSQESNACLLLRRPEAALAAADQALHIVGDLPEAFYNAGHALRMKGQTVQASANFLRAAELWRELARKSRAAGDERSAAEADRLAREAETLAR